MISCCRFGDFVFLDFTKLISAAIAVFFAADNTENFLQDDKYISFPVGQQQERLTGMKMGIKSAE